MDDDTPNPRSRNTHEPPPPPPPPPKDNGFFFCPDADVLAEILGRLPPNARRRARLVCRLWRAAVDERTPTNLKSRARPLVFGSEIEDDGLRHRRDTWNSSAHVIDDAPQSKGRRHRMVWSSLESGVDEDYSGAAMGMVGTRNGILCLCHNDSDKPPAGAIVLVNPVTCETLAIPPLQQQQDSVSLAAAAGSTTRRRWHETYSFAYDEDTGQYKILHIPCYDGSGNGRFDAVKVFTLGDPLSSSSWRDVPAPAGSSCSLGNGLLSIGGAAYWVTEDRRSVMSFHLWKECYTTKPLPDADVLGYSFHLAMVLGGRLGLAANIYARNTEAVIASFTQVWVAESEGWSNCYGIHMLGVERRLTRPDFALGGYILTNQELRRSSILHVHKLSNDKQKVLLINKQTKGRRIVTKLISTGDYNQTFAYVETQEPLHIYKTS